VKVSTDENKIVIVNQYARHPYRSPGF